MFLGGNVLAELRFIIVGYWDYHFCAVNDLLNGTKNIRKLGLLELHKFDEYIFILREWLIPLNFTHGHLYYTCRKGDVSVGEYLS